MITRIALIAALSLSTRAFGGEVSVFAAASLKTALDQIAQQWETETGNSVVITYAGSPALVRQIAAGAPADIFVSASVGWMDELANDGLIQPDSRRDLVGNTLVLIASDPKAPPIRIVEGFDLAGLLGDGKLSMALVDAVPAGQYGKQALETLGVWDQVQASVAQSENVRAALALVALGEAPYGIVYASDAVADSAAGNRVTVVGTFPPDSHAPIVYPAALLATSTGPEPAAFLAALTSEMAVEVFKAQGFDILE